MLSQDQDQDQDQDQGQEYRIKIRTKIKIRTRISPLRSRKKRDDALRPCELLLGGLLFCRHLRSSQGDAGLKIAAVHMLKDRHSMLARGTSPPG